MKVNSYYISAIVSFIIWGFLPFPLKGLESFASSEILYFRILFSIIALLFISLVFRKKQLKISLEAFKGSVSKEKKKFIYLTVVGGILLTINWFSFIYIINHINIQTGSFAYLICPILTALLGFLLLKETLSKNQWLAIILSIVSCILIGSVSLPNLALSLVIALSYAFYIITQRLLKKYDKILLLTMQLFISILIVGPFYEFFIETEKILFDAHFFLLILLISCCFTVLPLFLNLFALKELPSGVIGILMYINPILNFIIAFVYFQEKTTLLQVFAYFLILLSIIMYNFKFSKWKLSTNSQLKLETIKTINRK
ncbi:EamA family transporter [soil metagenome]